MEIPKKEEFVSTTFNYMEELIKKVWNDNNLSRKSILYIGHKLIEKATKE